MASEIDNLLNELRNSKESENGSGLLNNRDTWNKIGAGDFKALGFDNEEQLQQWILENPYSNL